MAEDETWYQAAGLPEDLASATMVAEAPDLATFVKSAVDNQAFLGSSIRIPGEDASDDVRAEFNQKLLDKVPGLYKMPGEDDAEGLAALFQKLGAPAEPTGYGIEPSDELPKEELEALQTWAHQNHLTKAQLQGLVGQRLADNKAQAEALNETLQRTHTELKDKWGLTYTERMSQAQKVAKEFFPFIGEDLTKANANIVEALADLGKRLGVEGGEFSGQGDQGDQNGMLPPAEAMAQVHEIMGNRDHAYWNSSDPAHAGAVAKVTKLMAMANPKSQTNMDHLRAGSSLADLQQAG